MASNLVVGLYDMAADELSRCGLARADAEAALAALFLGNAEHIATDGVAASLTGPPRAATRPPSAATSPASMAMTEPSTSCSPPAAVRLRSAAGVRALSAAAFEGSASATLARDAKDG